MSLKLHSNTYYFTNTFNFVSYFGIVNFTPVKYENLVSKALEGIFEKRKINPRISGVLGWLSQ